jgi:hypothetical protein
MKLRKIFAAAAIAAVFALPTIAQAREHGRWGDWDEHHEWRSDNWWHEHHPGWLYQHHPEWIERHTEWRHYDGDWDDVHRWHDRGWWFNHHPEWVREHHRDWDRWRDRD